GAPRSAVIPALTKEGITAISNEQKEQMLREKFFPEQSEADLSDIGTMVYPDPVPINDEIDAETVRTQITCAPNRKAPGPDKIANEFWNAIKTPISEWLALIFQACVRLGYYANHFRCAVTVALKKPNKDWTSPDSYRTIALLNTIGKIYEGILAKRLRDAAEEHNLFPRCQMGARKNRSTESALYHIVQQIQAAWGARAKSRQVVSILSLDMAGAFDRVPHERVREKH